MGPRLVPIAMVLAMAAFMAASLTAGFSAANPRWWRAAIELAILGGITPMIYAVNIRIVPVFARRRWRNGSWLSLQVALALTGAWLVWFGRLHEQDELISVGSAAALGGGILFTVNVVRLFRQQPGPMPPPPLPFAEQGAVDQLATHFTRLAGAYLLTGLGVGMLNSLFQLPGGRWELVWAHAMLVGFFLSMAAGVSYHVLGRWSGRRWRSLRAIRVHLLIVTTGLPLMLIALATGWQALFLVAGPLLAAGVVLFSVTIAPMLPGLPKSTAIGFAGAALILTSGVMLGAAFAINPVLGAHLRSAHAMLNLFGGAGFLISGVAYYLVPRFAGRPLRWPRLVGFQLGLLGSGILLGAGGWAWKGFGGNAVGAVSLAHVTIAVGFLLLGLMIGGTFAQRAVGSVASMTMSAGRPPLTRRG